MAGCGGSGPSEASIRERLEAAAAETAAAPTLESTGQIEAEAGNGPEPTGCIHARIDRATMAEVDALSYRTVCAHRPPREEAIAIGKVVDQSGYLTALTIAGAEDDPSVIVKDSYEMFGAPQRIVPPAPAGITDHRGPIKGKAELRELFLGLPY